MFILIDGRIEDCLSLRRSLNIDAKRGDEEYIGCEHNPFFHGMCWWVDKHSIKHLKTQEI